jgi:hypothetical protein
MPVRLNSLALSLRLAVAVEPARSDSDGGIGIR